MAIEDWWADLKRSGRRLAGSPSYAGGIVGTVAVSLALSTVVFGFIDVVVLRPLPFGDPTRTVSLVAVDPERGVSRGGLSAREFNEVSASVTTVADLSAYVEGMETAVGFGEPSRLTVEYVTPSLLRVWGVPMVIGRQFVTADATNSREPVMLLSEHLWAQQYGREGSVVGRSIVLNGRSYRIAGVVSHSIEVGEFAAIDAWLPLGPDLERTEPFESHILSVCGTLRGGASLAQAAADIGSLAARLRPDFPEDGPTWSLMVLPLHTAIRGRDTSLVLGLLAIVVVGIFGVTGANVTNMITAETLGRRSELAMSVALGASSLRLLRQGLTEATLLGVSAFMFGLALAAVGLRVLRTTSQDPLFTLLRLDLRVVILSAGLAVGTMIVVTIVPWQRAWQWAATPTSALKGDAAHMRAPFGSMALVGLQLSLSFVLLVTAGLSVRTLLNVADAGVGVQASGVSVVQLAFDDPKYAAVSRRFETANRIAQGLRAVSGVATVSVSDGTPLLTHEPVFRVTAVDAAGPSVGVSGHAYADEASPDYLSVFGIPLLQGRFVSEDSADVNSAAISLSMAQRFWPGVSPIGRRIRATSPRATTSVLKVVGVVGDVRGTDFRDDRPPRFYTPLLADPPAVAALAFRSRHGVTVRAADVGVAIHAVDPELAVTPVKSYAEVLNHLSDADRSIAGVFVVFAVASLFLATMGVYGLTGITVGRRTRDFGIRMAMGATRAAVVRYALLEHSGIVLGGVTIGALTAAGVTYLARKLLFGVSPTDPGTFVAVALTLTAAAACAICVSLRRMLSVNLAVLLRTAGGGDWRR